MLTSLSLENVGPAAQLDLEFAARLNLLTGDNGLGKSFLLDVAWWALTRRWPHDLNDKLTSGYPAKPTHPKSKSSIEFSVTGKTNVVSYKSTYDAKAQAWLGRSGRPWNPGLVIYAHADGGFSVWDPARNYWKKNGTIDVQERLPGYVFSPKEIWDGLDVEVGGKSTRVCNGLLADWAAWIRERGTTAERMANVINRLAPAGERFEVGPLTRLSLNDARDIPTINMPYAEAVPVLHAASGFRRALGMAYMLLWSWNENVRAAEMSGEAPAKSVVLLIDELESHLHPRWQRAILGAMLSVVKELHQDAEVQLIAATHSPLILASAEPRFDPKKDAWFDIDLDRQKVVLTKRHFVSKGDVSNWLTSEAFDLKNARSLEAEQAIAQALAAQREERPTQRAIQDADQALRKARLPDIDPFWVRWGQFVEKHTQPAAKSSQPRAAAKSTKKP